jgi:transposase
MMPDRRDVALKKEDQMTDVHILAIDLAKRNFQVCGTALGGACVDAPGIAR